MSDTPMHLSQQINPPCPQCGGKVYSGPRFDGEGYDDPAIAQWYCASCDWRVDKDKTEYAPTYVIFRTPESEVQTLRSKVEARDRAIRAWKDALISEDDAAVCHAENVLLSFIQP